MARWDNVTPAPYPPDAGVRARMLPGPVDPPPGDRPAGRKKRRRDPGNPSCEACAESDAGYCPVHADYYHEYDPRAGLA